MKASTRPLASLETLEGYRRSFMDPVLWQPYVQKVCEGRGWPCTMVRPGLAGTFPTFIVDEQRVIKFFGPLFDGDACWHVEQEAAGLMAAIPAIPVAHLFDLGLLAEDPGWRYLVFEFIPGISFGEVHQQIAFDDKLSMACWLGEWLPQMHKIKAPGGSSLKHFSKKLAHNWFSARWPEERIRWPAHLAGQVEAYLSTNEAYLQAGSDCFIHADLTQDHFLGWFQSEHWKTFAVIDFGDAMLGNLYYELVALHLDFFDCNRHLLKAFLESYRRPPDRDFVRKAMVTSLLHQFDVFGHLFAWKPALQEARTLKELADLLWETGTS